MKIQHLFICVAVFGFAASANTKSDLAGFGQTMPTLIATQTSVGDETLHLLSAEEVKSQLKVAPKANVKAWYHRPVGTMWQTYITTDGKQFFQACSAPYLHVNPWKDVTFASASSNASTQEWRVYHRKNPATYAEQSVTSQWGCQADTMPVLTAYDMSGNKSVYTPEGYNSSGTQKFASFINSYAGYIGQYRPGAIQHFWSSPKFFAADSNRDGTKSSGAFTASVTNSSGKPAGKLMGKNSIGIDGMAIAAEAPLHPYIIKRVGLRYQSLSIADNVTVPFKVTIYKLESVPAYTADGMPVIMDEPTEVLASTTVNVNNAWLASQREQYRTSDGYNGIMPFALTEPLEVNSAILVCVEGYNVADMNDNFSSVYSSDYFDEGHGEIGYVKMNSDGTSVFLGLRGGFVSSARYTAPAILLDEERRFLELNKADETGIWDASYEGNSKEVELFSYLPAAQIKVNVFELDKNGNVSNEHSTPEWLKVSLSDQVDLEGNPTGSGIVILKMNVTENQAQERSARIEMSFKGAQLTYTVKQQGNSPIIKGDVNGDGKVDVSDVTALINKILATADYPDAVCDINDDGVINVSDVTALVSIILDQQ